MDISTVIPLSTYYSYLKRFVISPTTMGTIAPSSRWLCYEMLDKLNWQRDIQIAELGAGTGVITQQILKRMSVDSSLDVFEIEPSFATELDKIDDNRLRVYTASAEKLNSHYNMIISGLPFLSIPKKTLPQAFTIYPGGLKLSRIQTIRDLLIYARVNVTASFQIYPGD